MAASGIYGPDAMFLVSLQRVDYHVIRWRWHTLCAGAKNVYVSHGMCVHLFQSHKKDKRV
jgi:hypothetical protein